MDDIPLRPENFRILNPEIIRKTGQALQEYTLKKGNVSLSSMFVLCCDTTRHSLFVVSIRLVQWCVQTIRRNLDRMAGCLTVQPVLSSRNNQHIPLWL